MVHVSVTAIHSTINPTMYRDGNGRSLPPLGGRVASTNVVPPFNELVAGLDTILSTGSDNRCTLPLGLNEYRFERSSLDSECTEPEILFRDSLLSSVQQVGIRRSNDCQLHSRRNLLSRHSAFSSFDCCCVFPVPTANCSSRIGLQSTGQSSRCRFDFVEPNEFDSCFPPRPCSTPPTQDGLGETRF